jgi:hypothetical protein
MHHQAAVAVEQHHGSIRARGGHPYGERDAVADRAELADGGNFSCGREGICATTSSARRVHHLPFLRQGLQRFDHAARSSIPSMSKVAVGRIADARGHRVASPARRAGTPPSALPRAQARIRTQVMARDLWPWLTATGSMSICSIFAFGHS